MAQLFYHVIADQRRHVYINAYFLGRVREEKKITHELTQSGANFCKGLIQFSMLHFLPLMQWIWQFSLDFCINP